MIINGPYHLQGAGACVWCMLRWRMLGDTPVLCRTALERKGRTLTSTSSVKINVFCFSIWSDGVIMTESVQNNFPVQIKMLFKSLCQEWTFVYIYRSFVLISHKYEEMCWPWILLLRLFNEWGDSESHVTDFQSNLTVPPNIVDEGTVVDTKVKEKHNVTLTCEASGNWHTIWKFSWSILNVNNIKHAVTSVCCHFDSTV